MKEEDTRPHWLGVVLGGAKNPDRTPRFASPKRRFRPRELPVRGSRIENRWEEADETDETVQEYRAPDGCFGCT